MITTFFLVIAAWIAVIIYTIYSFRWLFLFLCLLLTLIIVIKVRKDIKKYGPNSIFRAFHKYPTDHEQLKLVQHILKQKLKINTMFKLDSEILIAVSSGGIYMIKVLDAVGRISGNWNDNSLFLKNKEVTVIPNFFLELDHIENKLKRKIKNLVVKKIVVKKGTCVFEIPYPKEYLVIGMHNFYYQLQILEKEKRYTVEEIEEIKKILENNLSNNVKLNKSACTNQKTKLQSK